MKLYEITDQFRQLDSFLPEIEDGEEAQAYTELFDWLQGTLEEKVEGVCAVYRNTEAEADAIKAEIDRLSKRKKALENKAQRLKDYLLYNLEALGQSKVKSGIWEVSVKTNPPSCKVDEAKLPDNYCRLQRTPDLIKVKDALKSGQVIPGAWLESKKSVTIK